MNKNFYLYMLNVTLLPNGSVQDFIQKEIYNQISLTDKFHLKYDQEYLENLLLMLLYIQTLGELTSIQTEIKKISKKTSLKEQESQINLLIEKMYGNIDYGFDMDTLNLLEDLKNENIKCNIIDSDILSQISNNIEYTISLNKFTFLTNEYKQLPKGIINQCNKLNLNDTNDLNKVIQLIEEYIANKKQNFMNEFKILHERFNQHVSKYQNYIPYGMIYKLQKKKSDINDLLNKKHINIENIDYELKLYSQNIDLLHDEYQSRQNILVR